MRGGWRRFGLYIAAVAVLVVVVIAASGSDSGGFAVIAAQLFLIGTLAYLFTFVAWPRRARRGSQHRVSDEIETPEELRSPAGPKPEKRPKTTPDRLPAPLRAKAEGHVPERLAERPSRGRRPTERQSTGEMRWPAR